MPTWVLSKSGKPEGAKLHEEYSLGQVLGKGAFGVVYGAENKQTGHKLACKSIAKAKLVSEEDVKDVQREVQVLKLVGKHENVAELISVHEDSAYVHLVLELCEGGELFDRVIAKGTFTEKMAADYFKTMVEVVDHLHQLGVMHRDVKPENFLLSSKDDSAVLKLADFGLSAYFKPGQKFSHIVGSAYYVAPEVLRRNYGAEADMWSLGVILYILLSGLPPFWGDTEEDIFKMVLKGNLDLKTAPWPTISEAAKDCVRKLLTRDPSRRPSAREVLQHKWLRDQGAAPDTPLDSVVISRMRHFAAMNKLKKAALLMVAKTMSPDQIQGLKELFRSIDRDNSGTITVEELRTALHDIGKDVTEDELLAVMEAADLDQNGTIDYEEFIAATISLNRLEQEAAYQRAFQAFDTDKSGCLSIDEIKDAMKTFRISDDDIKDVLDEFDTNKDGEIDYSEFLTIMQHNNPDVQKASSFFRDRPNTFKISGDV